MKNKAAIWEDLVDDYLEVSADLKKAERAFLIESLKKEKLSASSITAYPTFQVAETLVVICKEPYEECWFYHPERKTIGKSSEKLTAKKINSAKTTITE